MIPYAKVDSGDKFRAPSAPRDKRESEMHRERIVDASADLFGKKDKINQGEYTE